jgi:acetyl-CoA carboxylase carboxyl transferase subunit alpha
VARHPDRPNVLDYVGALVTDFTRAGDRLFARTPASSAPWPFPRPFRHGDGTQKGRETEGRMKHNFAWRARGYRKAQRLMDRPTFRAAGHHADRYAVPIPHRRRGARPAEAIARSIETCLSLHVPLISVIIGEGGSAVPWRWRRPIPC